MPVDAGVLKRLRSAWGDPEITSAAIRERFGLNHDDMKELAILWGARVLPSPMPQFGGIRRRTNRVSGTWRRTDDERNAKRRAQR